MAHMTTEPESPAAEANPTPAVTETLGALLRRARLDKRVALEVAAKDTRIHATTLKALEEDARDELPAEVFTRGFIKIYAQYLGLDPDEALQIYLRHRGEKTAIPDEKVNVQEVLAGEAMADPPSFHAERHLFTVAVIILVTLILYLGYKITAPPPPPEPPRPAQIAEPQVPAPLTPQEALPPTDQLGQPEILPAENSTAATPLPDSSAVPPSAAQPLPAPPAPTPVAPTRPTASAPPASLPTPVPPPVTAPRQTLAPQASPTPSALPQPAKSAPAPIAAQSKPLLPATPSTPINVAPAKVAPAAPPPAKLMPTAPQPAATAGTAAVAVKAPLKELAPPGPLKKEKTTTATPPVADATKPAKEPSTAEKLIAAIKPIRPPYALEANFREDTWVRVQVDGEKPKPQYFRAGEKAAWQANSKMQLFIGNAGGVDLTLNNTKLPPLGKAGNTTRISIQPQPDQR